MLTTADPCPTGSPSTSQTSECTSSSVPPGASRTASRSLMCSDVIPLRFKCLPARSKRPVVFGWGERCAVWCCSARLQPVHPTLPPTSTHPPAHQTNLYSRSPTRQIPEPPSQPAAHPPHSLHGDRCTARAPSTSRCQLLSVWGCGWATTRGLCLRCTARACGGESPRLGARGWRQAGSLLVSIGVCCANQCAFTQHAPSTSTCTHTCARAEPQMTH